MPTIKLAERCSRCPRVDEVELSLEDAVLRVKEAKPRDQALVVTIDGKQVLAYDYLCEECRGICAGYAEGMRAQGKRSARRFKRVSATPVGRSSAAG